jgi:hypothetical protein
MGENTGGEEGSSMLCMLFDNLPPVVGIDGSQQFDKLSLNRSKMKYK